MNKLVKSPDWRLIYFDHVALVFVRRIEANAELIARYSRSRFDIFKHVLARVEWILEERPKKSEAWMTRARAQFAVGDVDSAVDSLRRVIDLDAAHVEVKLWLRRLVP